MVDKTDYKVFKDKVIYEPVAGVLVREAINNAIEISKVEKKLVELIANDVMLYVNANSNPIILYNRYLVKLDKRYLELKTHKSIQSKQKQK